MPKLGADHENLDTKIYHELKSMILERKLRAGEKIFQDKLAHDLGVSRTPLVNALKYLEREKLVKALPRRGYVVRQFTEEEMISIFELREVLEGLAARRAAANISEAQVTRFRLSAWKGFSRNSSRSRTSMTTSATKTRTADFTILWPNWEAKNF